MQSQSIVMQVKLKNVGGLRFRQCEIAVNVILATHIMTTLKININKHVCLLLIHLLDLPQHDT